MRAQDLIIDWVNELATIDAAMKRLDAQVRFL